MNDFVLRGRPPRTRLSLLDESLITDDVLAGFRAAQSWLDSHRAINLMVNPDWANAEDRIARMLRNAPNRPSEGRRAGAGPQSVRAASISDLLNAICQLDEIQRMMRLAHRGVRRQFRLFEREWNNATFVQRTVMVTMATLVGGSAMALILGHRETRGPALQALNMLGPIEFPEDIGVSLTIRPDGVEGSVELPLPVPGVRVEGEVGRSDLPGRSVDWQVGVTVDVAAIMRSQNILF